MRSGLKQIYVSGTDSTWLTGWDVCVGDSKSEHRQRTVDHTIVRSCDVLRGNKGDWESGTEEKDTCDWWVAPRGFWDHRGYHQICPSGRPLVVIQGVVDLYGKTLAGGRTIKAKGIQIKALSKVTDLSNFAVGIANNGGGTDGMEIDTLPKLSLKKGDSFWVVRDAVKFRVVLGDIGKLNQDYVSDAKVTLSGDDAIELFFAGEVVDRFGDPDVDGTGTAWDYTGSWVARREGSQPSKHFDVADWIVRHPRCSAGSRDNCHSLCGAYPGE